MHTMEPGVVTCTDEHEKRATSKNTIGKNGF